MSELYIKTEKFRQESSAVHSKYSITDATSSQKSIMWSDVGWSVRSNKIKLISEPGTVATVVELLA